jgi:segregation and condensation protein A
MVKRVESNASAAAAGEPKPGLAQTGHERRTQKAAAEAKVATGAKPGAAPPPAEEIPSDAYVVSLPEFEGPLDMLLHLAQKHELDLLDIPIGFITEKYLEYLKLMQALTIDLASEYLVMAATLAHIKSKLLLPDLASAANVEGEEEEELDPRAELIRRLLEYQKYKVAAEQLGSRDTLGSNVFLRGTVEEAPDGPAPFAAFGVFNLLDAFKTVLERTNVKIEHEVVFDRVSISDRIVELTDLLKSRSNVPFEEIFVREGRTANRSDIIITFLAILEMCRLRMMRAYQADPLAPIYLDLLVVSEDSDPLDMRASQPPAQPAEPEPSSEVDTEPAETEEVAPTEADASADDTPDVEEARDEAEARDTVQGAEAPETAEAPEAVEAPEVVEAAEAVEVPEEVSVPEAHDAPEPAEEPVRDTMDAAGSGDTLEPSESPETEEPQRAPDDPAASEAPEENQA